MSLPGTVNQGCLQLQSLVFSVAMPSVCGRAEIMGIPSLIFDLSLTNKKNSASLNTRNNVCQTVFVS